MQALIATFKEESTKNRVETEKDRENFKEIFGELNATILSLIQD